MAGILGRRQHIDLILSALVTRGGSCRMPALGKSYRTITNDNVPAATEVLVRLKYATDWCCAVRLSHYELGKAGGAKRDYQIQRWYSS